MSNSSWFNAHYSITPYQTTTTTGDQIMYYTNTNTPPSSFIIKYSVEDDLNNQAELLKATINDLRNQVELLQTKLRSNARRKVENLEIEDMDTLILFISILIKKLEEFYDEELASYYDNLSYFLEEIKKEIEPKYNG